EKSFHRDAGAQTGLCAARLEQAKRRHNPSRASLFKHAPQHVWPELWRWSSFPAYFLGEAGPAGVNRWEVLQMKTRISAASPRSPKLLAVQRATSPADRVILPALMWSTRPR